MAYVITYKNNDKEFYLVRRRNNYREWSPKRKDALIFHYTEKQIYRYIQKHLKSLETVEPIFTGKREKGLLKI